MITIKEIAKLAHVTPATVSNVLNGKGGASEAKARQIRGLAEKLHYTPNTLAKSLKRRHSNTIGIITEDLTVFNTPEIVDGIEAFSESRGFEMIMENMRLFKRYNNDFTDTEKHRRLLDEAVFSLLSKQVEGIIYIGYHCRKIPYLPQNLSLPFVYAYCFASDPSYPFVIYDDEKAEYDATSLLIQNSHRKIGIICGPYSSFHTQERLRGFQRCLFEHGLLYDNRFTYFGDWGRESGYRFGGRLMEAGATAIVSQNDIMACGIYDYCAERGLRVGKDVSLIGFDNREISRAYLPQLSTVEPPLSDIGRMSAKILIDRIGGAENGPIHCKMPCRLIERGSVAKISDS